MKKLLYSECIFLMNELKQQVVRLCLLAMSLTTCRLNDICKEVLHYFPDLV